MSRRTTATWSSPTAARALSLMGYFFNSGPGHHGPQLLQRQQVGRYVGQRLAEVVRRL